MRKFCSVASHSVNNWGLYYQRSTWYYLSLINIRESVCHCQVLKIERKSNGLDTKFCIRISFVIILSIYSFNYGLIQWSSLNKLLKLLITQNGSGQLESRGSANLQYGGCSCSHYHSGATNSRLEILWCWILINLLNNLTSRYVMRSSAFFKVPN